MSWGGSNRRRRVAAAKAELPASFYERRRWYGEAVACCVLLLPREAPTAVELPRELLSDRDLASLLGMAMGCLSPERLVELAARELGVHYVVHILRLAWPEDVGARGVYVYRRHWYVHQLLAMEQAEREYLADLRGLDAKRKNLLSY